MTKLFRPAFDSNFAGIEFTQPQTPEDDLFFTAPVETAVPSYPESPLVYVPGHAHLQWTKDPIGSRGVQEIESSLRTSISKIENVAVNSWYFLLSVEDIDDVNFQDDVDLFANWFKDVVKPMVEVGKVRWNTFKELYDLFLALEDFLEQLAAKEEVKTAKTTLLRALDYDYITKTLTFDPAIESGLYEFNYIVGWSAYEESEIMLSIAWKLHTRDGTLPYYKLFIDGELQELQVFNDLPAIA